MNLSKSSAWNSLRLRFPENEYVLLSEVCEESGGGGRIDFMAVNLWNSRGYSVSGIERKSNRGDWLKELKTPNKQEAHFKYCDYFYLLTDREGVAKIEEIPENWGWFHINEKGSMRVMKKAPKLKPVSMSRSFVCALLRRAADKSGYIHPDMVNSEAEIKAQNLLYQNELELKFTRNELDNLKEAVSEFEKHSGLTIAGGDRFFGSERMGKIVKIIESGGLDRYMMEIKAVKDTAESLFNHSRVEFDAISKFINNKNTVDE